MDDPANLRIWPSSSPDAYPAPGPDSSMKKLPGSQDATLLKEKFLKCVGKNIRDARCAAGKSQRGLAFECEMEPASICRIEAGRGNLTVATLLKIAAALEVPPATLVSDRG